MHVDESVLAPLRAHYGEPETLDWEGEVTPEEFALAGYSPGRRHDVTFFVFNGERLALIRKPHYPPGIWRPPGGGVKPGEDFVAGARREAQEELGVEIELERYAVASRARFRCGGETIDWRTHCFSARTEATRLTPEDTDEIEEARFGSAAELAGPIRARLLATGGALWRYRVALHDAVLSALA
jgi:ADP-ribose pyrophosphatase YjhB (NUDIX family)